MAGDAVAPRVVLVVTVALLSALVVALLALVSSGSMGPGSLAHVGPAPGALALAVGLEVLVGCGILLLAPRASAGPERPRRRDSRGPWATETTSPAATSPSRARTSRAFPVGEWTRGPLRRVSSSQLD